MEKSKRVYLSGVTNGLFNEIVRAEVVENDEPKRTTNDGE